MPGGRRWSLRKPIEMHPPFLASYGKGAYLYSTNGKRLLDCQLASGSLVLGHCDPSVVKAVQEQVARGSNHGELTEVTVEFTKTLVEAIPCADKTHLVNSGSEATMYALRLVRAFTGKEKILKFDGAYHGFHDYLLFNTSYGQPKEWVDYPLATADCAGIPRTLADLVLVAPYNDAEITRRIVENHKNELAAIFVEPVMRGLSSKAGFLKEIKEIAEQNDTLLVFDETITGFRLAYGGAQEFYGVTPDLATYGKSLGGGYPIGALAGREDLMSLLASGTGDPRWILSVGTSSGNPLSATAGLATLKKMKKLRGYEHLNSYGQRLKRGLSEVFRDAGLDVQMTGDGSIVEFFFSAEEVIDYRSAMRTNLELKNELGKEMNRHNILCGAGRYNSSVAHGETELCLMLKAAESSVASLKKRGRIPFLSSRHTARGKGDNQVQE